MYNKITLHNNCKDMRGSEKLIGFGFLLLRFLKFDFSGAKLVKQEFWLAGCQPRKPR